MSISQPVNRQFYSLPKPSDSGHGNSEKSVIHHGHGGAGDDNQHIDGKAFTVPKPQSSDLTLRSSSNKEKDDQYLLAYIRENIIGFSKAFSGPFGLRTALYLDFVASGRALKFIEDYIFNEVLPEYGNTHTTTSITSLQTTLFRHEARDIVRNTCNASEHDSVIFTGTGTTGAVHKLIHGLHLRKPAVVLTGPYEHHSNILPWIEARAKVVRISATESGTLNLEELEECLTILKDCGGQLIGAFSAASNVTGVLTNVNEVTACLHAHGALAFWDYAAAAPYVKIDMNPFVGGPKQHLMYKDAVYFSVHKFVGGIDCPGVLIAKKSLFQNPSPDGCGGGTVFYVRRESHRYLQEPEMREEGGTPAIVGSIRAGLVLQLKDSLGTAVIQHQDIEMLKQASLSWSKITNLVILGPPLDTTDRLPIFSFLVYHPQTGRFLHHNFLAALLNDIFGIQARGGCACAGPYAMDLLGIRESVSKRLEQLLVEDSKLDRIHLRRIGEYSHREFIRPGFVRINLPYFLDKQSLKFVLEAVSLMAEHAWKLLPQYLFNPETGEWRHKQFQTFKDRKWLGHISYASGKMSYHQPAQTVRGPLPASYQDCIDAAKEIFTQAEKLKMKLPDQTLLFDEEVKHFRWFVLPSEAYSCLTGSYSQSPISPSQLPFYPPNLLCQLNENVLPLSGDSATQRVKDIVSQSQWKSDEGVESNIVKNGSTIQERIPESKNDETTYARPSGKIEPKISDHSNTQEIPFYEGMTSALEHGFGNSDIQDEMVEQKNEETVESSKETISVRTKDDKSEENLVYQATKLSLNSSSCALVKRSKLDKETVTCDKSSIGLSDEKASNASKKEISTRHPLKDEKLQTNSTSLQGGGKKISKWFSPPKTVFKPTISRMPNFGVKCFERAYVFLNKSPLKNERHKAIEEYNMLHDGDRVLVCLSGGKDSLSLLHTIRQYKFYAKGKGINFDFGAVTIDPQTPSYDPSPLKEYLSSLDVPYFYESQCILETANNLPYECASICSFCSRMKRGRIYAAARREGYNVLALGQHLDDLSESFMMSFLHNGALNTMKAHYTVKEGDLRVIRPFIYVRETDLRCFAEKNKLPIIAENCPACFEAPKERHRIKQLLAAQEVMFPQVYNSMLSAMKPLMARERQGGHDKLTSPGMDVNLAKNDANTEDDNDEDFGL